MPSGCCSDRSNSLERQAAQLRQVILETMTVEDMKAITKKLIELGKDGDLYAIRLLFRSKQLPGTPGGPTAASHPGDDDGRGHEGDHQEAHRVGQGRRPVCHPAAVQIEATPWNARRPNCGKSSWRR